MMVDVTVLEQTPELHARQQELLIWSLSPAQLAVESIDGPELLVVPQHHKLHLVRVDGETGADTRIGTGELLWKLLPS